MSEEAEEVTMRDVLGREGEAMFCALRDARNAIASLEVDALGWSYPSGGQYEAHPIRDELLSVIDCALSDAAELCARANGPEPNHP